MVKTEASEMEARRSNTASHDTTIEISDESVEMVETDAPTEGATNRVEDQTTDEDWLL